MKLITLLKKFLGDVTFLESLPDFLFSGKKSYHLSFYQVLIDTDCIPKAESEHIDKKLRRLSNVVSSLKGEIRDLDRFISNYDKVGDLQDDLNLAKGIYSRLGILQITYSQKLSNHRADWESLAKSRAIKHEVVASFLIDSHRVLTTIKPAGNAKKPIELGVEHIAININPRNGDLFYYWSHQALPRMGSGTAHVVNFENGKLKEINSYETYLS